MGTTDLQVKAALKYRDLPLPSPSPVTVLNSPVNTYAVDYGKVNQLSVLCSQQ